MPSARRPRTTSKKRCFSAAPSMAVGSSKTTMRGLAIRDLAISTSCCMPAGNWRTGVSMSRSRPRRASTAPTRAVSAARRKGDQGRRAASAPRHRLARTDRSGASDSSW